MNESITMIIVAFFKWCAICYCVGCFCDVARHIGCRIWEDKT
jgi:hypothetical protein